MQTIRDIERAENLDQFERIKSTRKAPRTKRTHTARDNGCDGKVAMRSVVAKNAASSKGMRAYRCQFCGAWHITSHTDRMRPLK